MSEKYSHERQVMCAATGKAVNQKIDYAIIRALGNLMGTKKLVGTFCFGYPGCNKNDCQLVVGKKGVVYSEPLEE
jgi:hypothetical protein